MCDRYVGSTRATGQMSVSPVQNPFFVRRFFFTISKSVRKGMADVGEREEGGTGAAGGQGGVSGVQSVAGTDTNALAKGGVAGGGGAPVGSVFAFSAEQVRDAIVKTEPDLADGLREVTDELLGKQARLLKDFLPKYAGAIAGNLAASVQVLCCCVHAWCKLRCVCAEMHALWRVCIAVHDIYCRTLLDIAACLHVCMFACLHVAVCFSLFLLVTACCMFLHKCGGVRNGVGSVHADELLHKCGGIVFAVCVVTYRRVTVCACRRRLRMLGVMRPCGRINARH